MWFSGQIYIGAKSKIGLWCAWGMGAWLILSGVAHAGIPTEQVRATADRVLEILNDPQFAHAAAKQAQRDRLREAIYPRFDFEDMSRRSLGPTWRRISKAEQDEFVQLFKQLLEDAYLNNIQGYKGEKISYTGEAQERDYARVDTKLIPKDGEPITITYNLHKVGEDWKVYDVVIDNISIVNNYRAQFARLVGKGPFSEVLARIREKLTTPH